MTPSRKSYMDAKPAPLVFHLAFQMAQMLIHEYGGMTTVESLTAIPSPCHDHNFAGWR